MRAFLLPLGLLLLPFSSFSAEPSFSDCPCEFRWRAFALGIPAGRSVDELLILSDGRLSIESKAEPSGPASAFGAPLISRKAFSTVSRKGLSTLFFREARVKGGEQKHGEAERHGDLWRLSRDGQASSATVSAPGLESLSVAYLLMGADVATLPLYEKRRVDWISRGKVSVVDFSVERDDDGWLLSKVDDEKGESVSIRTTPSGVPIRVKVSKKGTPDVVAELESARSSAGNFVPLRR